MDVDDYLKTIEKKLQVTQCNNREKVLFASHQLEGPSSNWWDAYVDAHATLRESTRKSSEQLSDRTMFPKALSR
jgi:hypothetical protein